MSERQAENPFAWRPVALRLFREPVSAFEVDLQRAELFGDFYGQEKAWASIDQLAGIRIGRIVQLELGVRRDMPSRLAALLVEPPFHSQQGVSEAGPERRAAIACEQIRHLVLELYPVSQAIVDVEERRLEFTFRLAPELRGSDIDLPVPIAGRAGVVGAQRRTALRRER